MNTDLKHYLVIATILGILFFIVLFIPINKPDEEVLVPTSVPSQPLPTKIIPSYSNSKPLPTLIPVETGTGVKEEELTQEIKDLSMQKQELRSKIPLKLPGFNIGFDYAKDKFIVTLDLPKNNSKISFETWLKANYSAITMDRFIVK